MQETGLKPKNMEERIEKIERELFTLKMSLKRQKTRKTSLNDLVQRISSRAAQAETTSLIRKMRDKEYA